MTDLLNVPENANEILAGGTPDDSPRGKAQKAMLSAWVDLLEEEGVMEHVLASYEVVSLLAQYSPPLNPQQLKAALISKANANEWSFCWWSMARLSPDNLHRQ